MRGIDHQQADMFSYLSPEQRVRTDHPLRAVRALTDEILEAKSPLFDALYAECGRPSIPPEKLLRALLMLEQVPGEGRITVGGDKGFDTAEFVAECRHMNVTPHVAQNTGRASGSAIDARTTRHRGYAVSQKKRKTDRRMLRLAEGHRSVAQARTSRAVQGGMDLHLRRGGLQPGAIAEADSDSGRCLIGP